MSDGPKGISATKLGEMYFEALRRDVGRGLPDAVVHLAKTLCAADGTDPDQITFREPLAHTGKSKVMCMPQYPMPAWCFYEPMAQAIYEQMKSEEAS